VGHKRETITAITKDTKEWARHKREQEVPVSRHAWTLQACRHAYRGLASLLALLLKSSFDRSHHATHTIHSAAAMVDAMKNYCYCYCFVVFCCFFVIVTIFMLMTTIVEPLSEAEGTRGRYRQRIQS
jgi:hypothetical protein